PGFGSRAARLRAWWQAMTSNTYARSLVCRCRRSQCRHTSPSARHTCSIVSSGFFPPEPLGVLGHEAQRRQAQHLVPHQGHVVAALEVREPHLAPAHPEAVLHAGAAERHPHPHPHEHLPPPPVRRAPDPPPRARPPPPAAPPHPPPPPPLPPPARARPALPRQAHPPPALPQEGAAGPGHLLRRPALGALGGPPARAV